LPLKKGLGSIAVIGPNADEAEVLSGNYNGTPVAPVTVLAGIRAAAGAGTKVTFARGGPLATGLPDLHVVPGSAISTDTNAGRKPGLMGFYYGGHFDGGPVLER
jgi:beta-glucosidase